MNDIDKMPSKCRDCPYWEFAAEPYICSDCTTPVKKRGGDYILRSDIRAVPQGLWSWARYMDAVERVPAADVETVVRCRDCKFASTTYDGECKYCACFGSKDEYGELDPELYLPGDFFCAFGVRKEVDDAEVH